MITKERLLSGLNEFIHVEEDLILLYINFSKALLKETPVIEKETKERTIKLLSVVYRDSTRHKELVYSMIEDIKGSAINEY